MLLDPVSTKEKAWNGIHEFIHIMSHLLVKHKVNSVRVILYGSVHRGEARCPRGIEKFYKSLLKEIAMNIRDIQIEDKMPSDMVHMIIHDAYVQCNDHDDPYNSTNNCINYVEGKLPGSLLVDIMKEERCSDLDVKISIPDESYDGIHGDIEFNRLFDFATSEVEEIISPLSSSMGFINESQVPMLKNSISHDFETKIINIR
jgi:hypothetical protein